MLRPTLLVWFSVAVLTLCRVPSFPRVAESLSSVITRSEQIYFWLSLPSESRWSAEEVQVDGDARCYEQRTVSQQPPPGEPSATDIGNVNPRHRLKIRPVPNGFLESGHRMQGTIDLQPETHPIDIKLKARGDLRVVHLDSGLARCRSSKVVPCCYARRE
jgi:hypothetical protein